MEETFICEKCKKEIKAERQKYAAFIECECGGRAYEKGYNPDGRRTNAHNGTFWQ